MLVVLLCAPSLIGQPNDREEYIKRFAPIVKQKMREFGIPASISMAQGILESGAGTSRLALEANNHFGIKCHREWTGETFLYDDDHKNECFRKYPSPAQSYHDHSLFLTQRPRYADLFKLPISDYSAWAHGLKAAGYATNPSYAQHLIRVIEENKLFLLDQEVLNEQHQISQELAQVKEQEGIARINRTFEVFGEGVAHRIIFLNNKKIFVIARPGDTYFSIANDFGIRLHKLLKYNDVSDTETDLEEGAMVYLEGKRPRTPERVHIAGPGETWHSIAQLYGIRLINLYRSNGWSTIAVQPNQIVRLR